MEEKTKGFDKYLTNVFSRQRDAAASRKFYDCSYGGYLPADKEASILDFGCGTGEFIAYLLSKGYKNVAGLDMSPEMVEFCRKSGISNVNAAQDTKAYLLKNAGKFDLVTMNDVIEHLPKDETIGILEAVRGSLKNGGAFLLRTGNFSTPGGMYLRYKDFTHETGYTDLSLGQALRMAGFREINIRGNKYPVSPNLLSVLRAGLLRAWFFILKMIYTLELGCDRPKIYSKLLVAYCKK